MSVAAHLTASGYSPDEAAEIVLFARKRASLDQWIEVLAAARPGENVDTAIAHVKLGRTLLHESQYRAAERETRAGYEVLLKQMDPQTSFVRAAQSDLIATYKALGQPENVKKIQDDKARMEKPAGSL